MPNEMSNVSNQSLDLECQESECLSSPFRDRRDSQKNWKESQ